MKTEHIEEHCGTADCPRCVAVWAMLERFKIRPEFTRGTKVFQLAEHAVDLEEANIEYRMGRTSGTMELNKVDVDWDTLGRCLSADRHAYLLDNEQLETGDYTGGIEVYLDGFVCNKQERRTVVREAGTGHKNWGQCVGQCTITGPVTWGAQAAEVAIKAAPKDADEYVNDVFNGSRHLVYVVNNKMVWACKHIAITNWITVQVPGMVHLKNPAFMCAGVTDKRTTGKLGDDGDVLRLTIKGEAK